MGVVPERRTLFGASHRHLSECVALPKNVSRHIHLPLEHIMYLGSMVNDLQSNSSRHPDIKMMSKASVPDGVFFFSPPAIKM